MSIIHLNKNYFYDDFILDTKALEEKYYPFLQKQVIGISSDHREIIMLKVGRGEKNIFCTGSVHARETTNLIVLMKMIETYLEGYINKESIEIACVRHLNPMKSSRKSYNIYQLLQEFSFYFIPLLNPDGYMIALKGFDIIKDETLRNYNKSLNIDHLEWKYNGRGVDINRNFPSITFRAKSPEDYAGSEKETKALIQVFQSIPSVGFIDYHSRGKSIYYYRNVMPKEYNFIQKNIADTLKRITGYFLVPKNEEIDANDTGGNTVHFYSEYIGAPAITIETVEEEEEFPLDIKNQIETYKEIVATPLELASFIQSHF